jgi:MerR family transcriptional regulator/heat shock protein HspR
MSSSDVFTVQELARRWGVEVELVEQLAELGVIEAYGEGGRVFSCEVTLRVGRFVRLQRDLGVNVEGAVVILELLDRIEALEQELRHSRRR